MRMLMTLLGVRLRALLSGTLGGRRRRRTLPMMIFVALCLLYAAVTFLFLFFTVFSAILPPLEAAGAIHVFFAVGGGAATVLMLAGSVILTKNQLYVASDSELLLSMPIKPSVILASRLIPLLLINALLGGLITLPMLAAYLLFGGRSLGVILSLLAVMLLLPLLCQAISALLAYLIARIGARIRRKNILTLLFSLVFLAVYFGFAFGLEDFMVSVLEDIGPLVRFVDGFPPLTLLGRAIGGEPLPLCGFLLLTAAVTVGITLWLSRTYLHTVLEDRGGRVAIYREKRVARRSPLSALLLRELSHLGSSAGYMLNAGIGLLLLLALPTYLLIGGGSVLSLFESDPVLMPLLPAMLAMAGMALCATVMFSASTVSLEGRSLWVIRTAPVPTRTVLLSKWLFHVVLTAPCALAAGVMLSVAVGHGFTVGLLLSLTLPAFSLYHAALGLAANLWLPKLDFTNEMVPIKQGGATLVTMFGGIASALVLGAVTVFLSVIAPVFGLLAALLLCLGATAALLAYILTRGVRDFEAL